MTQASGGTMRLDSGWLNLLAVGMFRAMTVPWTLILRKNFGSRYLGLPALGVVVLIPLWTVFFPEDDCRMLLAALPVYLALCVWAKVTSWWQNRGSPVHSQYDGASRLQWFFPAVSEFTLKRFVEPVLAIALSTAVIGVDKPLGSFLLTGAMFLLWWMAAVDGYRKQRITALHDAMLDQQDLAEGFRRVRGF